MPALFLALSGTLGNIVWSSQNRRHENEPLRLRLALLDGLGTTDDEDEEEHE